MKIAVINTGSDDAQPNEAQAFLPKLLEGLTDKGNEVHLMIKNAPGENVFGQIEESNPLLHISLLRLDGLVEKNAPAAANWLNELNPDIYLIWNSDDLGWAVLPLLNPQTATLAVGHADSEIFYRPTRYYRPFLTRVIGTTPEVCVGIVINCVIDKERVEWISQDAAETGGEENTQPIIETYENCFEKAIADAHAAPREIIKNFPPMKTKRPASQSWFDKLKAKIMN